MKMSECIKYGGAVFLAVLLLSMVVTPVSAFSGSGTENDPYLISSAAELAELAERVNAGNEYTRKYFRVTHDIDLSEVCGRDKGSWTPIGGVYSNFMRSFNGIFDGGGFTIENLYIDSTKDYHGLFGVITGSEIRNVNLTVENVTGRDYVGGLVGDADFSRIENCYVTGSVTATGNNSYVGGLVGDASGSLTIKNCYATGSVTGTGDDVYVGGLVGHLETYYVGSSLTIENCYATGSVTGTGDDAYVGGLVGKADVHTSSSITLDNSYATGSVTGTGDDAYVGGLVGHAKVNEDSLTIKNCYATGSVTGTGDYSQSGGLVGDADLYKGSITIDNSYATGDVNGDYYSGGLVGSASATVSCSITIENSYATGRVTSRTTGVFGEDDSYAYVGGLVGYAGGSGSVNIENCYATGSVTGRSADGINWSGSYTYVGGLVGSASASGRGVGTGGNGFVTIEKCYATGSVTATDGYAGGLIGSASNKNYNGPITIENCYATGSVTGDYNDIGGLVGNVYGENAPITIENCYATGSVTGGNTAGGLVGNVHKYGDGSITIHSCVALNPSVSGSGDVGRILGSGNVGIDTLTDTYALSTMSASRATDGIDVSSANASSRSFYENTLGWDFISVWRMDSVISQYPIIRMETNPDPVTPTITPTAIPSPTFSGSGTVNDPYLISSAAELAELAERVNAEDSLYNAANYAVTQDIDLSGYANWTPIGKSYDKSFMGSFNGSGYAITGLTIYASDNNYTGMFGFIRNAEIRNVNLTVENVTATSSGINDNNAGGLVGIAVGSVTIKNCHVSGNVTANGDNNAGGLVGIAVGSVTIDNCYASVNVTGRSAGGLVGGAHAIASSSLTLANCHATGRVNSIGYHAGGLIGYASAYENGSITIDNCYATGSVTGTFSSSFVGDAHADEDGSLITIENCYATGSVTSTSSGIYDNYAGGLIGRSSGSITIENSYVTGNVTATDNLGFAGGLVGRLSSGSVTINSCVALNPCVSGSGNVNRIAGIGFGGTVTCNDTYALSTMSAGGAIDGINVSSADAQNQSFYEGIGWNFINVWKMDASTSQYPILRMEINPAPVTPTITPTAIPSPTFSGSGTENDPYLISSAAELAYLAERVNAADSLYNAANYTVTQEIDLSGYASWTPIGTQRSPFKGSFNGSGKAITGLTIYAPGSEDQGLFGDIRGAEIMNVNLAGVNVTGGNFAGGLIGYAYAGFDSSLIIENCYATGNVTAIGDDCSAGGLVGYAGGNSSSITIENCYATGNVAGDRYSGGLVGHACADADGSFTLKNCYATCSVTGVTSGGLVGEAYASGGVSSINIENCYATGSVTATGANSVGGLVGGAYASGGCSLTLKNCYAAGSVTGVTSGGIVGYTYAYDGGSVTIENCHAAGSVTGGNRVGGLVGYADARTSSSTTIRSCAALNPCVSGSGNVGRIAGGNSDIVICTNNYALITMSAGGAIDGINVSSADAQNQSFYEGIGWNFISVWKMDTSISQYPILRMETNSAPVTPTITPEPTHSIYFTEGTGTPSDPYQIGSASDLKNLSTLINTGNADEVNYNGLNYLASSESLNEVNYLTSYYKLTDDVDLSINNSGTGWTPIGTIIDNTYYKPFSGTFDGAGHIISNITIISPDANYLGFFGYVKDADISNLTLKNVTIIGAENIGSLVGYAYNSRVDNCIITGNVNVKGNGVVGGLIGNSLDSRITRSSADGNILRNNADNGNCVGGLIGMVEKGIIDNCYAEGSVEGKQHVGSLVGYISSGKINNCNANSSVYGERYVGGIAGYAVGGSNVFGCSASGDVTCTGDNVGGLIGNTGNSIVANSIATGDVVGLECVGGLIGSTYGGTINNCYAKGSVDGSGENIGGLIGLSELSVIKNSYAAGGVNGQSKYVGGLVGYSTSNIEKCYAVGNVISTGDYVGGLVGCSSGGSITNSIALNMKLTSTGNNVGRVVGQGGTLIVPYAWDRMSVNNVFVNEGDENGNNATSAMIWSNVTFYRDTLGWDFNMDWKMNSGNGKYQLPVLKHQNLPVAGNVPYLNVISIVIGTDGLVGKPGKTLTIPVNISSTNPIDTYTFLLGHGTNADITINTSATTELHSRSTTFTGYNINNLYSLTQSIIMWDDIPEISGKEYTMFYIDVIPDSLSTIVPIELTVEELAYNSEPVSDIYTIRGGNLNVAELIEIKNTTSDFNAETKAEIGYYLTPSWLQYYNLTAPNFTYNLSSTTRLNEKITAVKIVNGVEEPLSAIIKPDNNVSIIDDISDADYLNIFFVGRFLGDINNDDKIRGSDALDLARYIVNSGASPLTEIDLFYGDVDGDGNPSVGDVRNIARKSVNLTNANYGL